MITLSRAAFQAQFRFNEYYGLSTDIKPTAAAGAANIPNGSTLYCMDNQTTFMYDAEGDEWIEQ